MTAAKRHGMTVAMLRPEDRFIVMIIMAFLILALSGAVGMMICGRDSNPVPPPAATGVADTRAPGCG
jgi:hypothetical protein